MQVVGANTRRAWHESRRIMSAVILALCGFAMLQAIWNPMPAQPGDAGARGPITFTIGLSTQGRPLTVYQFGQGPTRRALIGGIHGGYEWNTVALMSETIRYLGNNPQVVPPQLTLYILPNANPDGYAAGTDSVRGRMNAGGVDLNRNWDYRWQMTATHGTRPVYAGSFAFSEPETRLLRDFVLLNRVSAAIIYHSAYGAVFHGAGTAQTRTEELAELIAKATGYRLLPGGVPGQITTGNSIDWLTVNGVTAIEVELRSHRELDWERNLRGLKAFLNWSLAPP